MLESTALVAYSIYPILSNTSMITNQLMINNGYTQKRSLPIFCSGHEVKEVGSGKVDDILVHDSTSFTTVPPERGLYITMVLERREKRMTVLQKYIRVVARQVQDYELKVFVVKTHEVMK